MYFHTKNSAAGLHSNGDNRPERESLEGCGMRFALFGDPIGHSLSPAMHRAAYASMGLTASYKAYRLADAGEIIPRMRSLSLDGASVTIPHKEGIAAHLDEVTANARMIGAVNTVVRQADCFVGDNTDWLGLVRELQEHVPIRGNTFAVLGAGGMARAAIFGILRQGGMPVIFNRTPERGAALVRDFHCPVRPLAAVADFRADVLINTTPVGMHPYTEQSPVAPESLPNFRFVMDAVYNPRKTKLLREAEAAGCTPISGIGLFVRQGAEQIRIWTGREAPAAVMQRVVLAALPEL